VALRRKDAREVRGALHGKATNFRYSDVAKWLQAAGFSLSGAPQGSHRVWVHPSGKRVILVEKGAGEILPAYVKRAAKAILELGGCTDDEPDDSA
jgi:predicted RNA binding protein YcfA (HicA-like mRNA interferase family)